MGVASFIALGAAYHAFFKSGDASERAFYFGFLLFSLPFFCIPIMAGAVYEGTRISLHESKQVLVTDSTGAEYRAPFSDFQGYAIEVETETDSEGRTDSDYSLKLMRKTGVALFLYEAGDRDALAQVLERAQSRLSLPVTDLSDFAFGQSVESAPLRSSLPSEEQCLQSFQSVQSLVLDDGGCRLTWQVRVHPAIWIGIALPLVAIYFLVLFWKIRGYSHKWAFGLSIAVLVLAGFGYAVARAYHAESILEFRGKEKDILAYVNSPYFGRMDERGMPLEDVAFVAASIGDGDTSIILYDRDPLAGGLTGAMEAAFSARTVMIYTDGLPVTDRLALSDLLAESADW